MFRKVDFGFQFCEREVFNFDFGSSEQTPFLRISFGRVFLRGTVFLRKMCLRKSDLQKTFEVKSLDSALFSYFASAQL